MLRDAEPGELGSRVQVRRRCGGKAGCWPRPCARLPIPAWRAGCLTSAGVQFCIAAPTAKWAPARSPGPAHPLPTSTDSQLATPPQGLDWYERKMLQDEDGDVAHEFFEEPQRAKRESGSPEHKRAQPAPLQVRGRGSWRAGTRTHMGDATGNRLVM